MFFAFSHTIIFRIYIPVVSGVKVLFQGVRFICALEGRGVLYPLTPTSKFGFKILGDCFQNQGRRTKTWRRIHRDIKEDIQYIPIDRFQLYPLKAYYL